MNCENCFHELSKKEIEDNFCQNCQTVPFECDGQLEAVSAGGNALTDEWECLKCGTIGKWAYGTEHFPPRNQ